MAEPHGPSAEQWARGMATLVRVIACAQSPDKWELPGTSELVRFILEGD